MDQQTLFASLDAATSVRAEKQSFTDDHPFQALVELTYLMVPAVLG